MATARGQALQTSGVWPRRAHPGGRATDSAAAAGRQELGNPPVELVDQEHYFPPDRPLRWQAEERDQDGEDF